MPWTATTDLLASGAASALAVVVVLAPPPLDPSSLSELPQPKATAATSRRGRTVIRRSRMGLRSERQSGHGVVGAVGHPQRLVGDDGGGRALGDGRRLADRLAAVGVDAGGLAGDVVDVEDRAVAGGDVGLVG